MGLAALGTYGVMLDCKTKALYKWPEYVKNRVQDYYMYLAGSVGIVLIAGFISIRSPALMYFFNQIRFPADWAMYAGATALVVFPPYSPGFGNKQLAWIAYFATFGASCAADIWARPAHPIFIRSLYMVVGMVGGLIVAGISAPNDEFLNKAGPLGIALGVLCSSTLAAIFCPPIGARLSKICILGGAMTYWALSALHDMQKNVESAKFDADFDPVAG
jgi:hypothetical protein